jgi:plastocyanin
MTNVPFTMLERMRTMLPLLRLPLIAFTVALATGWALAEAAQAAQAYRVSQKSRAFNFKRIAVERGDTVQFVNDDEFIHQIFIESPAFNVDTAESPPGQTINVRFTAPGMYEVHCHIHPKMLLAVTVK